VSTTVLAADQLGSAIGDAFGDVMASSLDEAMQAVWEGSTWLLSTAFNVADALSTFTVDTGSGPLGAVWPTLLAVSSMIALGLFFWQLAMAGVRGGRGMLRVATGPVAYGIALAMTVGVIAGLLGAADGLTALFLSRGLNADNFAAAFTHTSLGGQALNGVKAVALGLIGFFGLVPAALGWVLEIVWRQATILVLVATVPITAAGLLAQTTASWFWRGLRWTAAAIAVKPVLALILVMGVSSLAGASGPVALLAGVAVLWVSLTAPMALFRLLAFVDPATDAGAAFRESWAQFGSRISGGGGGGESGGQAGFNSQPGYDAAGNSSGGGGGVGSLEAANTARFDAASGSAAPTGSQDMPPPPPADPGSASGGETTSATTGSASGGSGASTGGGDDMADPAGAAPPPRPPDTGGAAGGDDGSAPPTRPIGGPGGGSGGSAAAAGSVETEAVEAAVIL
jgi:hypothetical protein